MMVDISNPQRATITTIFWDGDFTIPTGRKMNSVDTSGTIGANLIGQTGFLLGVAMGGT